MGIVLELQKDALKGVSDVIFLLREVRVISYKLGLNELFEWAKKETEGYSLDDPIEHIPKYRHLSGGRVEFFDTHGRYRRLPIQDEVLEKQLNYHVVRFGIPKIQARLDSDESGMYRFIYAPKVQKIIDSKTGGSHFEYSVKYSIDCFHQILEDVRGVILDWTLLLESKGIVGDGLSFSDEEKDAAASETGIARFVINNIYHSSNVQIQQDSTDDVQKIL